MNRWAERWALFMLLGMRQKMNRALIDKMRQDVFLARMNEAIVNERNEPRCGHPGQLGFEEKKEREHLSNGFQKPLKRKTKLMTRWEDYEVIYEGIPSPSLRQVIESLEGKSSHV